MKPTKNVYFCQDCGRAKMLFESKLKADTFINFNKDKIREESGFAPKRSYFCLFCAGWHITSKEEEYGKSRLENSFEQYKELNSIERTNNNKGIIDESKFDKNKQEIIILKEINNLPSEDIIPFLDKKIKSLENEISTLKYKHIHKHSRLLSRYEWTYKKYLSIKKSYNKRIELVLREERQNIIVNEVNSIPLLSVETYINSKINVLEDNLLLLENNSDSELLLRNYNVELNLYRTLRKSFRIKASEFLLQRTNNIILKIEDETKNMTIDEKETFLDNKYKFIEKRLLDFIEQREESYIDDAMQILMENELDAYEKIVKKIKKEKSLWQDWVNALENDDR